MKTMQVTEIARVIDSMTLATEDSVFVNGKEQENFKAIIENDKVLKIFTKEYTLIQHREAFAAALDALLVSNKQEVKAHVVQTPGRAYLTVVFDDLLVNDGAEGIKMGFRVSNSHLGEALKIGGSTQRMGTHLKFFGFRLACSNGMIIQVPMEAMTVADMELTEKKGGIVQKLVNDPIVEYNQKIMHKGNRNSRVQKIYQQIMVLYKSVNYVENYIKNMQSKNLSVKEAEESLVGHFGPRVAKKVMEQYMIEEQTVWGLYNAITYKASHENRSMPNSERMMVIANAVAVKAMKVKTAVEGGNPSSVQ